jgi:hypothetical protein
LRKRARQFQLDSLSFSSKWQGRPYHAPIRTKLGFGYTGRKCGSGTSNRLSLKKPGNRIRERRVGARNR